MPYPQKTGRAAILAAALEQLERGGFRSLSLRSLAASLELAPNALYRYFGNRAELEAALSAESIRRLQELLTHAATEASGESALRSMASAYLQFAREHPHLYEAMMRPQPSVAVADGAHEELWRFVGEQVGRVARRERVPEASVAFWAFLHGVVALEQIEIFGEEKPHTGFDFGLEAWLAALRG